MVDIATKETGADNKNASLISPFWDFFCMGGAWLVILPLILFAVPPAWQQSAMQSTIGAAIFWAPFFLNFPHFFYSYYLLYGNFAERVAAPGQSTLNRARLWVAGVAVPFALIAYLAIAALLPSPAMIALGMQGVLFFLGWHHTKQGYGVLILMSHRKGVMFDVFERRVLRINTYIGWLGAWVYVQTLPNIKKLFGVDAMLDLPPEAGAWALGVVIIGALAAAAVLARKFAMSRVAPSWSGVVGYFTPLCAWIILSGLHPLLPLVFGSFHALQYLPFAMRLTLGKIRAREKNLELVWPRFALIALVVGVAGYLVFNVIPVAIDQANFTAMMQASAGLGAAGPGAMGAFISAAMIVNIFVNIHHYFIDNAIWRHDNPELRRYL